ncbi:MAG: hypothetical protein KGM44_04440 [bacterium]|nr:hypothetical protein [bacterium]
MSRALAVAAALLFALALWLARHPGAQSGVATRDFEAYWSAGRAALAGGVPYARGEIWSYERQVPGVDASREELLPFVSPPPTLLLFEPLARLPYDRARVVWLAVLEGACALGVIATFGVAGWQWRQAFIVALVALTFSPLTVTLALGQLAGVVYAALAVAIYALGCGTAASAVALACSAVQPNIAIVGLAGVRRSTAAAYAIAAALIAASTAALYHHFDGGLGGYLAMLTRHGAAERGDAIQFTLPALLGPLEPRAQAIIAALSLLVCAAPAALLARRSSPQRSIAFACALLPFAVPFLHQQDLIVLLIPAAFALATWRSKGALLGALGTAFAAIDWVDLAQRPAHRLEDLALAAAGACAIASLHPSRSALWLALPTVLACVLAPLAARQPMPIWPLALPAGFHAPSILDASAVWGREQLAAGLMQAHALWIALRALTLLGCLLLAAALAGERLTARAAQRSRTPRPAPAGSLSGRD